MGVRSGDLGGHSTCPRRPNQWPGNCRKQTAIQLIYMYGDFRTILYITAKVSIIAKESKASTVKVANRRKLWRLKFELRNQ